MPFLKILEKNWKLISLIVKICAITFALLFALSTVAGSIMIENSAAINSFFNVQTSRILFNEDENTGDTEYFKSDFNSVKEVKENGEKVIEEVMEEGATLLKNDNNALPLKNDAKISLFSVSSVDPVITGTGSSGTSNSLSSDNYEQSNVRVVDFKTAFEDAGVQVNPDLWNWYVANKSRYLRQKSGDWGAYFSIRDAKWDDIPQGVRLNEYKDAAVFVVSRRAGEGNDMGSYYADQMVKSKWPTLTDDVTNGNYLALSPNELSVLRGLKEEKEKGNLSSIIVLINSANPVQCDFVDDETLGVDAIMWCGTLGQTGTRGVANLMAGKANPSGRLSDTFWKYHYLNPVHANFAMDMYNAYEFTEEVKITWLQQAQINSSDAAQRRNMEENARNTVYAEGIYVGYRYTETRYEDSLSGITDFDYYGAVTYPFGYGLSYTTFEYSNFSVTRTQQTGTMEDSYYTIEVTVENTGSVAGKEVVQIYLQKPYTPYDVVQEIEKASVELVDFEKTKLLEPGEKTTLTFTVNERELACYDANGKGTYILEQGDYYFTAAKDAHDAVNNIIKAKNAGAETSAMGNTGEGKVDMTYRQRINSDNFEIYSTSKKAFDNGIKSDITKITNQFEEADIFYYEGAVNGFEYITRSNWEGTVKLGFDEKGNCLNTQVRVKITDEMFNDRKAAMSDPEPMGGEYPKFGVNNDPDSAGHLNLIDLRAYSDGDDDVSNDVPIPYNDALWDTLLDQLTWEELTSLLNNGWRLTGAIESIAKPETVDFNGSVGLVREYGSGANNNGLAVKNDDPDKNEMICFYPCNGISASTFNKPLMEEYGEQWGEDSLWSGCAGLYGMGVNLHRSPYGGRNFEYYSEDPVLSGIIASYTAKGCKSKGLYCYLKHCVLNEQESYRIGGYYWFTEQTMREIYLKAFQIPIEDNTASCVMTAEPALGVKWSGQQGFVQTVLRDEFGMTGIAVSDYTRDVDGNYLQGLLAGSDLPDGTVNDLFDNIDPEEGYGELAQAMRESAHRILYTVVHSNAMNGFSSNTRVIKLTPAWLIAIKAVKIIMLVFFVLSAVLLVAMYSTETVFGVLGRKGKSAQKAENGQTPPPFTDSPEDGDK